MTLTARGAALGFPLLLLVALLLGAASTAEAVQINCSDPPYNGVIDGNLYPFPDNVKLDINCTIKNYPGGMSTNFSFDNNDPTPYLIIFDNVLHTGQMACNSVAGHVIWFVNGSSTSIQEGCQNLLIPVEKIDKQSPAPFAAIGVPFTYTLTIPVLYDAGTGTVINSMGSVNDLHSIILTDDLNATGADLTYVSHDAYWRGSGTPVAPPPAFSNVGGVLTFDFNDNFIIPAGEQIVIEITVVLNDTPANVPGTVFTNTAKWSFGRLIDGVFYEPLPGEWGISPPMTIVAPNLVVTKTSSETALNLGVSATFTIDVQNTGGGDAWNTTIEDNLPPFSGGAGMCDYDPRTVLSARIVAANGTTLVRNLTAGTDYTLNYTGAPTCQLSLTMTAAGGPIGPGQHLIITYETQLDAATTADNVALTNVAGATEWFSADGTSPYPRRTYTRTLSDGTPAIIDHQDSYTLYTALAGYYFQKTVENLTSGENPATTAAPGDRLRYRLRLFNVDQTIDQITISDVLDPNSFDLTTFAMVTPPPAGATYSFNSGTGLLVITGDTTPLNVGVGGELVVEFEITLLSTLTNGTTVDNQATLSATGITALSDDPYVNGIAPPGDPADPTSVLIQTPGPLLKANTRGTATIGEQFSYRITVPATPVAVPLYDVRILDDLGLSDADLQFVSATVVSGGAWTLSNTGSATNLIIRDTATGIDIPANGQAVIEIRVELRNTITNQSGLSFANSASYTYNRMNGNNATQTAGGAGGTTNMNVVEPDVSATKAVSFVTPAGKLSTDPATVGDVLEYLITIPNSGNSTAFDTSVVDTLPANVSLVPNSATAQINGVAVTGFVVTPTTLPGGALAWGQRNGDLTLDIPAGQTLVLTYQVTVAAVTGLNINNSAFVDWTSLDGGSLAERTGTGCPTTTAPNDYCYGPATVSVATLDNTSIAKSAVGDSYAETPPSTTDPIVRVGDTVTYDLTLNLQEYTTSNVVVEDDLPAGMALGSFTITGGANFSYTLAAQPAAGDTGTLRWEFGDITNQPSNDGTPIDTLVIQYVARVVTDAPPVGVPYDTSILRNNLARLSYTGGDPAVYPNRLTATETIDVRQPQMRAISKIDLGTGRIGTGTVADPYQVNISTDVMNFRLSSCNDGLAPAYGVVITDLLAPELDESDLVANPPIVRIGTATLIAGTHYTYTAPTRGGEMRIALLDSAPVNPGECITVDYNIGFHTDLTVSSTWSNQARLPEYWSLPLSEPGRLYTSTSLAEVWMTNLVNDEQLLKTLVSPVEATIGDDVVYQITVPAAPVNTALDNVVVTDTLHGSLEYVSASAVDGGGAPVILTDNSVPPGDVNLVVANIPAGGQVIITLTARVANNDQANAGVSFTNTASYTYVNIPAGLDTSSTSGPVTIVEPLLAIAKTVANVSNPGVAPTVGDILRYSVTFAASGGAAGDTFSDAFDLLIEDRLSLGLAYQSGSASVNGTGNTIADPTVAGDGSTTPQTLTWSLADGPADIDVVEGTQVTLTYDVVVLNGVLAGQNLTNSATVQWTGQDGANPFERNGTGAPVENDYFAGPATLTMIAQLADSIVKSVVNVTTGQDPGTNAEPGDTLRYTLVLINESIVPLNNVTVVDELDAQFAPGSLQLISVSDSNADTTNTNAAGGANGTGIVDIRNLTLAAQGDPNDSVTIVFEARLVPVIQSGTTVLNQAQVTGDNLTPETSNITSTLISSAPAFRVLKTVQDITSGTSTVMAGDILRYTITAKNIGTENAVGVTLRDLVPANTSYVANTTRLNGAPVADPSTGVSALQNGMLIHSPANLTAGAMPADASATTTNVATVTFDVQISTNVVDGTIISNQGFVNGSGAGSGPFPEQPSDNPATPVQNDPTSVIVGNLPLVYALKTVQLAAGGDVNGDGRVNPGDTLQYTITLTNSGATPATGVVLTDAIPANTTYVANSTTLNGAAVADPSAGVSPLANGMGVVSSGLTPPSPPSSGGTLAAGGTGIVTFKVQVNNTGVPPGTVISNQGSVATAQLPTLLTDSDGNLTNGYQPTVITVGDAQQLSIIKSYAVVDGGVPLPGSEVEYTVQATNVGTVPATSVVITDDLDPLAAQVTYVANSATMNSSTNGVSYASSVITANYGTTYGTLAPGSSVVLRFRVTLNGMLTTGTTVTNTAQAAWNSPTQTAAASVSLTIGAPPNTAIAITKTAGLVNVTRGQLVPYTITLRNTLRVALQNLIVVDTFPPGFKYLAGSARVDGQKLEPAMDTKQLSWNISQLTSNSDHTIKLLLVVGSGVSEGEYVNQGQVFSNLTGSPVPVSGIATATVRVTPDPDFDCTDVIGKVFDDRNLNGEQDSGEEGLFGVRVVTARGLIASTDQYGRFHMTCAVVPDEDRGSNFILKLDERSLPSGYRLTTENPRVQRATRGKMMRFNFGATIHRVVRIDIADGVFEPDTTQLRMQWTHKIDQLLEDLKKGPSVLRLSYLGDVEPQGLVQERLETLKQEIVKRWEQSDVGYPLSIETEIFWRRGTPLAPGAGTWTRETDALSEATEMHLPVDETLTPWIHDPAIFERDEGDRTEMRKVVEQDAKTIKLDSLVRPIHFGLGEAEIPDNYPKLLRDVLDGMRDRANVRLHFVGHTDSLPLRGELITMYGDNVGLSRERAGTVAEYFQGALNLQPEAVSYEGLGDSRPVAGNGTEEGRQLNRRVEVQVWYDEISEKQTEKEVIVPREVSRIKICRTETVCKLRYKDGHSHRARVRNLISPLHYDKGVLSVPEEFLQQVRQTRTNLGGKQNLVVKFVAYTDNLPLEGRDKRIYGDSIGLSKAVARRVSLAVQEDMGLPNAAIETEGKGASQPVAPNDTQQGRALNRRVEVEFWYDDPLQDLPDEPQPCPDAPGAETVTRVYDSPSGSIDPILFDNGQPVIPDGYIDTLRRIMDEISDKTRVRLRFVGYTGNKRLDRRTAAVYGDDVGLSMARARRAMAAVSEQMGLTEGQAEFDGRGYVQSDDVINAGFVESETSRVEVKVVYDELIIRDDYEGVEVTPLTREVHPVNPFALNLMRITVDGKPVDDPGKSSSDVQRCTDVALEDAQIQFKHDSLKLEPRLNVTAWPRTVQYEDSPETEVVENLVSFRLYTNYHSFIERAEVRIFEEEQSERDTPIAVVEIDADGMAQWQPEFESFAAPVHKLKYLVRVYDKEGLFDETSTQPLWVVDQIDPSVAKSTLGEELLAGYGESRIAVRNIPLRGGTVEAHGTAIPKGHGVWMAGHKVPVDDTGSFVAEEILPDGIHTVEVGVLDQSGSGRLFLRDLALKKRDWFTVGIADLTLSANRTDGPAELLAPDKSRYSEDTSLEGRLAFYTNGKFENGWSLTASADTREGPLGEIFSNFQDKSPDALFRRVDPDYHYPTFGDDSTVEEDAPTSSKFYLKMKKENNYMLLGNFKLAYTDNDLAHVDRGLYGANLHYQPLDITSFGEPRLLLDGFVADPGTVAGRDEFLGTDGSLYFLRRQDILEGSERVRIEVRDKDSGMVLAVQNLTPVLDYDIDYLQGRILLAKPLPTTADEGMLVSSGSITGNPVFLVVRYEFTPGFDDPNTLASGGRVHYWFDDHVKVGMTLSQDEADVENSLGGADLTLRKSSESWIRLETGRTTGPGLPTTTSNDGGFNFDTSDSLSDNDVKASAYRIDTSLGFKDLFDNGRGKVTFYLQDLEAGYSAPGLVTAYDLTHYGGTADLPVTDRLGARLKMDKQVQAEGLETEAGEVNIDYRMSEHWTLSSGIRRDSREDNSVVVPVTQEVGDRTDAVARLQYDSRARWLTYVFGQETIKKSGNREDNGRTGVGGRLRVTDRFNVTGEVSGGDLGTGGNLGTEYLYSDRTTLYSNYTIENDRTDNGLRARKGKMTSGFRTRYSDSASVYLEEQYTHGDVPTGLMHSTGVNLTPTDRLNLGANLDFGTLKDHQTGAELKRTAAGVSAGYGFETLKIASALEYRVDDVEQPDTSFSRRTTWLLKNSLNYRLSPDWRLIGKFNYAVSESSMGDYYNGEYTEAVLGYAYRPVHYDRLNALLKYTYFYNVPAVEQVTGTTITPTPSDYIQRSHIGSLDVMYDLTSRWSVGGKYAHRYGQLAQDRNKPEFFESRANLYVLRADWHFVYRWDALLEVRRLDLPDAEDSRSGLLLGIYRHLGDHIQVGAGYNFSDFSDDLTQLDYRHEGLFINLIGKY